MSRNRDRSNLIKGYAYFVTISKVTHILSQYSDEALDDIVHICFDHFGKSPIECIARCFKFRGLSPPPPVLFLLYFKCVVLCCVVVRLPLPF